MTETFPGQLVYVTHEPDAGPWRLVGYNANGTAILCSVWHSDHLRHLLPSSEAFKPYPLLEGCVVQVALAPDDDAGPAVRNGVIERLLKPDENAGEERVALVVLDDGIEMLVLETQLFPLPPDGGEPLQLLKSLCWRGPWRFFCRWWLQESLGQWYEASEGLPGFLGARVRALGHQIYAARRILWDRAPRFILADEVGLGKTIEAGLVIQALTEFRPDLNVLVIAPGSMTRQWLCELYLKFGARPFTLLECLKDSKQREQDILRLLGSTKAIVSATALIKDEALVEAVQRHPWDLIVVDEAHQIPPGHSLYPLLRSLSAASDGYLALSATPSRREVTGLLGLLALVAPESYSPDDVAGLNQKLEQKQAVWDSLTYTFQLRDAPDSSDDILPELADEWRDVLGGDPIIEGLAERLDKGDFDALNEMIGYVQEFHRLDHRLIRTRRRTLGVLGQSWSARRSVVHSYHATTGEALFVDRLERPPKAMLDSTDGPTLLAVLHRLASTVPSLLTRVLARRLEALDKHPQGSESLALALQTDPGPGEEDALLWGVIEQSRESDGERDWLIALLSLAEEWAADAPWTGRFEAVADWLDGFLCEEGRKVLVFAQERDVVRELASYLRTERGFDDIVEFRGDLPVDDLSNNAIRFQRTACRVLVSDELGGEGRNFQVADAVLHVDTPWSVSRLEQRIGRLDRLGRPADKEVLSVIMLGPARVEQQLLQIHRDVFRVFERSVGGLEFVLPKLQKALFASVGLGPDALRQLKDQLQQDVTEARATTNEEFDLSLDSSRLELERAVETAELIEATNEHDGDQWLRAVRGWARIMGVEVQRQAENSVVIRWEDEHLQQALVGFKGGTHRFEGTFNRLAALEDERLQYFAPGHRVIDALVATLPDSAQGRATVFVRSLGMRHRGSLFLIALVKCYVDEKSLENEHVSAGLLTRVRSRLWPEVQPVALALRPTEATRAKVVSDWDLTEILLCTEYRGKAIEPKVSPDNLDLIAPLRDIWASVEEGMERAVEHVHQQRQPMAEGAAEDLKRDLGQYVGYLEWRLSTETEPARRQELEAERQGIDAVLAAVRSERVEVDAVAIVVGG